MLQNGSFLSPPAGEAKAGSGADISLGPNAPAVLQDLVLLEKLAQFDAISFPSGLSTPRARALSATLK